MDKTKANGKNCNGNDENVGGIDSNRKKIIYKIKFSCKNVSGKSTNVV